MTWYYLPNLSECSNFAPDTEGSPSDSASPELTPEPFVTLSGTPTQRPLSWRGWKTRPWIARLSGLTSPPSTVQHGVDEWISSLPASHASLSPQPVSVEVSMTSDGSGPTSPGSLLTWDRDSCSWRTSPSLFDSGYLTSSPTLPRSGSMRNGVCSQRPPLALRINGNGSGFWPTAVATWMTERSPKAIEEGWPPTLIEAPRLWGTPVARDDQKSPEAHMAMKERMGGGRSEITSLTVQAKAWPTPRASMNENRTSRNSPSHGNGHGETLAGVAGMWSALKAHNSKDTGAPSEFDRKSPELTAQVIEHGRHFETTMTDGPNTSPKADLNPRFVERLMNVPDGWSDPTTSVTGFTSWVMAWSLPPLPERLWSFLAEPKVDDDAP